MAGVLVCVNVEASAVSMFRCSTARAPVRIRDAEASRFAVSKAWEVPTIRMARIAAAIMDSARRSPEQAPRRLSFPRGGGICDAAAVAGVWMVKVEVFTVDIMEISTLRSV